MKAFAFLGVMAAFSIAACKEKPTEVEIDEVRSLTTKDEDPILNATSEERFLPPEFRKDAETPAEAPEMAAEPAKVEEKAEEPANPPQQVQGWKFVAPEGWRDGGKRMMREINLAFGESGEIYVSVVGGGIGPNADRWFRQFGNEPKPVDSLEKIKMVGVEGVLVETKGRYEPGMGRPGKDGQALLGAMVEKDGRLITVKMIADEAEVAAQREGFMTFVQSLQKD